MYKSNTFFQSLSTCHCRDGWIHGNGSCYYMPNQKKNWNDARAFCQQLGAHLAVIGTPEEDKIVSEFLTRSQEHFFHIFFAIMFVRC